MVHRSRPPPVDEASPAFRGGALKRTTPPKSEFKGLAWDRQEQCWRVRISYQGKQRHVGRCGGGRMYVGAGTGRPDWCQQLAEVHFKLYCLLHALAASLPPCI
jgi:hypothetical protein